MRRALGVAALVLGGLLSTAAAAASFVSGGVFPGPALVRRRSSNHTGTTDSEGRARFESITAGDATVCFTGFDAGEWGPA